MHYMYSIIASIALLVINNNSYKFVNRTCIPGIKLIPLYIPVHLGISPFMKS